MNELFKKIIDSNTINLTTFKKSGVEVHTPVWVVNDEEYGYVRTYSSSGKVKRKMNNYKVTLASCTSSGNVIGNKVSAKAEILELDKQKYTEINKKFRSKYHIIYFIITLMRKLNHANSTIIRLKYTLWIMEVLMALLNI